MSYKVVFIPPFERQLKRLSKRYPSMATDYAALLESLEKNPLQGEPIGKNCYKLRLVITSKNRGKRGGGRLITHVIVEEGMVYLLSIYDKSEQGRISDKEIERLLTFLE